MKKNLFKFFLLGAFSLALGFGVTGCNNVTEDEFKEVCERIDALEGSMTDIQTKLDAIKGYVVSVEQKDGADNVLVITYANPASTAELTIPVGNTEDKVGSVITQQDGFWVFDGTKTAYPVAPAEGWQGGEGTGGTEPVEFVPNYPRVNEDGYWEFFDPEEGEEGEYVASEYYAGAWATREDADAPVSLWIYNEATKKLEELNLSSAMGSAGIAKIDILGWVTNFDDAKAGGLSLEAEVWGKALADDHSDAGWPVSVNDYVTLAEGDPFDVNYAWIKAFYDDADLSFNTSGTLTENAVATTWAGGDKQIAKGSVLNTLAAQRRGILVQVHPANQDISSIDFTMVDAQGRTLPIGFGKPEKLDASVRLTRAASSSALYFIQGDITKAVYTDAAAFKAGFTDMFAPEDISNTGSTGTDLIGTAEVETVWSLKANGIVVSEYTPFTFVSIPATSLEAPIEQIRLTDEAGKLATGADVLVKEYTVDPAVGADEVVYVNGGAILSDGGTGGYSGTNKFDYIVEAGKWYQPRFDTSDDALVDGETNTVIDFYMKLVDNSSDYDFGEDEDLIVGGNDARTYIKDQFGLVFNGTGEKTATAFKVGHLPDNLTLAWFDVDVYKLGIDGVIYVERVRIRPVRSDVTEDVYPKQFTTYAKGEYPIIDKNFASGEAEASAEYHNSAKESHLSGSMIFDLKPMFDKLAKIPDGQASNLAQRWQNPTYGAKDYEVRSVSIDGVVLTDTTTPTFDNFAESFSDAVITGHKTAVPVEGNKAGNAANLVKGNLTDLNTARSIVIQPTYADAADSGTAATTPMFQPGKEYVITLDFFEDDANGGDYLNTLNLHFTPVIPQKDLVIKDKPFWNAGGWNWTDGKTDVLNAFYKDPNEWAEGMAPNGTRYDIALNEYTAITSDGWDGVSSLPPAGIAGGNGGFTQLGTSAHSGEEWAILNYTPKYGTPLAAINVAGTRAAEPNYMSVANGGGVAYPTQLGGGISENGNGVSAAAVSTPGSATADDNTITLFNQYFDEGGTAIHADLVVGKSPVALTAADKAAGKGYAPVANNYYGVTFHMDLDGGAKYLNVYEVADPSPWEFDMRIMSALYEGRIEETGGKIVAPAAAAGTVWKLTDKDVKGYTYNNQVYSLFTYWNTTNSNAEYVYTYIDKVEWFVPAAYNNIYSIVDETGAPSKVAVDADGADIIESYVAIKPGNISQTTPAKLTVRVYDRFGKVKTEDLDITITVGATN